jgi:hypothetical protein
VHKVATEPVTACLVAASNRKGTLMESILENAAYLRRSMQTAVFGARAGQRWLFRANRGWLGGDRLADRSVLWFSCAFVLMGLALLAHDPSKAFRSMPTQWPSVLGTVVSMQVEERHSARGAEWVPHLTYHYSVSGRQLQNTRVTNLRDLRWTSREDVNRFLARYAGRDTVRVYYNPLDITQSVLEPEFSGLNTTAWGGLLLIGLGLCTLTIYARMR